MTYALSQTLILPALPALVRQLGASPLAVSWLLTAYLVAASVATPLIGRLGDLFGRGRALTWVMAIFCFGSIVCALGQSLPLLVAGRVLQGVAGGVFPLAYGIIRDTFPPAARMRAIGTLSVSLGVGAALGPAIAGVIVDRAGPSAIFWVGMIGAIPALAAARLVPERPAGPRAQVDWLGAVALAGALTALLVLVTQGQRFGWTSGPTLGVAAAGAVLARWWVAIESRRASPLMDLALLRRRTLALTNGAALCVGCGIFMAYVPLAAIAQAPRSTGYGLGLSVAASGALLIPHGVAQILAGPWTGGLCARIGSRATLTIGTSVNAVTMGAITAFHGSALSLMVGGGVPRAGTGLLAHRHGQPGRRDGRRRRRRHRHRHQRRHANGRDGARLGDVGRHPGLGVRRRASDGPRLRRRIRRGGVRHYGRDRVRPGDPAAGPRHGHGLAGSRAARDRIVRRATPAGARHGSSP